MAGPPKGQNSGCPTLLNIQDPVNNGYDVRRSSKEHSETGPKHTYKIQIPTINKVQTHILNIFEVSDTPAHADRIVVKAAWNGISDKRPKTNKMPLRGLILGIWIRAKGRLKNLVQIYYMHVVERDLVNITPAVFEKFCCPVGNTIIQQGRSVCENEAFNLLASKTPFGAGAMKMVGEYEEMIRFRVKSFQYFVRGYDINDGDLDFDIAVNLERSP